ncbi:MAG: SpoIID/LytB domain-containing protein, partial [Armatimonadota bacterium]
MSAAEPHPSQTPFPNMKVRPARAYNEDVSARKLYCPALLILLLSSNFFASEKDVGRQTIRVGLVSLGDRSTITIVPQSDALASIPSSSSTKPFRVRAGTKLAIRWRSRSEVSWQDRPSAPALRISCSGLIAVADRLYPDAVEVWPDPNGRLAVINEVSLEHYVRGVLLAEAGASMHPEALKALAVAARSYALSGLNKHRDSGFDLCDTTHCQGYRAYRQDRRIEAAVSATCGEVLLYNDLPIPAAYCTDCGGATANNEDAGFGATPKPYLRGVKDASASGPNYCSASRYQS